MKDRIVLLTKDALCKSYLPIYGNKTNVMPNLSELADKGTVFHRFYTCAPSTAMSFIGMFTQKNSYETDNETYVAIQKEAENTVFDQLSEQGYDCQIIWDEKWIKMAKTYSQCYGKNTKFNLININQTVGAHHMYAGDIAIDDALADKTVAVIKEAIENVVNSTDGKLFLWIHLPHVLLGRNCYGSDMDMFDRVIGHVRSYFSDDAIFISADHGNMNGIKNKICYGFDVYEPAINIPFISPRIDRKASCDTPVSNIHVYDLLQEKIPEDEFVFSDCAYYKQIHRKLAIIHGDFKYIYNKESKTEELYDLRFDPGENCNIVSKTVTDVDRKVATPLDQVYYYPDWDRAQRELEILRAERNRIWRQENKMERLSAVMHRKLGRIRMKLIQHKK